MGRNDYIPLSEILREQELFKEPTLLKINKQTIKKIHPNIFSEENEKEIANKIFTLINEIREYFKIHEDIKNFTWSQSEQGQENIYFIKKQNGKVTISGKIKVGTPNNFIKNLNKFLKEK